MMRAKVCDSLREYREIRLEECRKDTGKQSSGWKDANGTRAMKCRNGAGKRGSEKIRLLSQLASKSYMHFRALVCVCVYMRAHV